MNKPTKWRTCEICSDCKRTTNTDTPYIGRECYKTKGRDKLLDEVYTKNFTKKVEHKPTARRGFWILLIVFGIGILLGKFVF